MTNQMIEEFKNKKHLTNRQIRELQTAGRKIDVKVTRAMVGMTPVVHIRDHEFTDFTLAAILLHHIAVSELPSNHEFLI